MKIGTEYVSTPLKDYSVKIHWRNTMNYAAAINDNNPYYFDDERNHGIVAPPMYAVAITWPLIENIRDFMIGKKFSNRLITTMVHYSEHLAFHRLIKPGDDLTIKGNIVAILPHRSGTHIIIRLNALDQNNMLVFTEHIGGLLRGVECVGKAKGEENLPIIPQEKANSNSLWKENVYIDKLQTFIYDGCTNIFFPIHTSKKFAHMVGLPNIILQGTATLACAVKEITNKEAKRNPEFIREIACNFTDMVLPGTEIEIHLKTRSKIEGDLNLFFEVYNNEQKKAIRNGYIKVRE
ncbi:MAG: MaoC/PaaZ C-terminal domain-containing protein [Promethearchaeota archaeon]